jgi:hypothetical protein
MFLNNPFKYFLLPEMLKVLVDDNWLVTVPLPPFDGRKIAPFSSSPVYFDHSEICATAGEVSA